MTRTTTVQFQGLSLIRWFSGQKPSGPKQAAKTSHGQLTDVSENGMPDIKESYRYQRIPMDVRAQLKKIADQLKNRDETDDYEVEIAIAGERAGKPQDLIKLEQQYFRECCIQKMMKSE